MRSSILISCFVSGALYFFSEALKKNMPPVHVQEDLVHLGVISIVSLLDGMDHHVD